jgi:hypothetical protein
MVIFEFWTNPYKFIIMLSALYNAFIIILTTHVVTTNQHHNSTLLFFVLIFED